MKPDTAVELVGRYARLSRAIKCCKARIAAELEKCPGQAGFRLEREHVPAGSGGAFGHLDAHDVLTARAEKDQATHLDLWYGKDYGEPGEWGFEPFTVGEGDEESDCPHCYAAHLVVQERKQMRRQLGAVKALMTRLGGA